MNSEPEGPFREEHEMKMTSEQVAIWAVAASNCMQRNFYYFDAPYYYTTHSNQEHVKQLNTWIEEVAPYIHGFYMEIDSLACITGNVGFEYISIGGNHVNIIIKHHGCRRELNIPIEAFNHGVESIPRFVAMTKIHDLEKEVRLIQFRIDRETESLNHVVGKLTEAQDEFHRLYGLGYNSYGGE